MELAMANPAQVTISVAYFNALQDLKNAAASILDATEGTPEYAEAEDFLQGTLGAVLMLEDGKD